jgi:hypothetical protein
MKFSRLAVLLVNVTAAIVTAQSLPPPPANVKGVCVAGCGSSNNSSNADFSGLQTGVYNLSYSFFSWLFSTGPNPAAQAQQRQMMAELAQRQAEAARQQREEEARRLAEMYNRLASKLKLRGLPELQFKERPNDGLGLHLKMRGDDPTEQTATGQRAGIKGLPGIYLEGGENHPYGIPGLPGIYTGGEGPGSGLKMRTREDEAAAQQSVPAPPVPTAASSANPFDPSKMTAQQMADVIDTFSKLPPEEQQRLLAAAQQNATGEQPPIALQPHMREDSARPPAPTPQGAGGQTPASMSGQPNQQALASLQQQVTASQAAAQAPVLEDASAQARVGFDTAGGAPLVASSTRTSVHNGRTAPTPAGPASQSPHPAAAPLPASPPAFSASSPPYRPPHGDGVVPSNPAPSRPAPERQYVFSGNGLILGTGAIVYAHREPGESEKGMCDAIRHQALLAHKNYMTGADCEHYQFVLGLASSLDEFTDLRTRVVFDELSNSQFSAGGQLLYNKLRNRQFAELGCHSNGAMICLAALENGDVLAADVLLYGPQITRESLQMWNQLVSDHKVHSVKIYLNENDIVPGVSISFREALPGGVPGPHNEPKLLEIEGLTRTIHEEAPKVLVQSFACSFDSSDPFKCHAIATYRATVGCAQRSHQSAAEAADQNAQNAFPEPPVPCGMIGAKP